MRSPSSGSGTTHPQPDLLARNETHTLCIELKYQDEPLIYLAADELAQLKRFSEPWPNAVPLVVGRWKRDTNYYAVQLGSEFLVETNAGRYRIKHGDLRQAAGVDGSGVRILVEG